MKYCFTTLAIGESFEKNAIKLFEDLSTRTDNCAFHITTMNNTYQDTDRLFFNVLEPFEVTNRKQRLFLYNLKVLALKDIVDRNKTMDQPYEYIIFIDGDWNMDEKFNEEKILNVLNYMESQEIDLMHERYTVLGELVKSDTCFFPKKIEPFHLLEHNKWDDALVPNEQFFILRNSWKYIFFTFRWEQLLWYTVHNDVDNFAEGVEMGISALEAEMKCELMRYDYLDRTFYFFNSNGRKFEKF